MTGRSLTYRPTRIGQLFMFGLLAGLLALGSGCGSSSSPSSAPAVSASDSRVRLDNSATLGAVDMYVVARPTAGNVDITGLSPTFVGVAAGTRSAFRVIAPADYQVIVTTAGTKTELVRGQLTLTAGLDFTAFLLANGSGAPELQFTQQTR
jgi:hypothetical protein